LLKTGFRLVQADAVDEFRVAGIDRRDVEGFVQVEEDLTDVMCPVYFVLEFLDR
jgi:hypothetical protein